MIVLNGTSKIIDDDGDYLTLIDYGSEGFSIDDQNYSLEEAMNNLVCNTTGSPMVVLKLVKVDLNGKESS